jgi:hypothetical protein
MTTYPKFSGSWNVTANPNGELTAADGSKYYALYWDEKNAKADNFNDGFYVTKTDASNFLTEKLTGLGLNWRERDEFIMYWLPKLENNGQSLVRFVLTDEAQAHNAINISPKPDSLLRIEIHIKKVDSDPKIPAEKLPSGFTRNGFTAVEWGGSEY